MTKPLTGRLVAGSMLACLAAGMLAADLAPAMAERPPPAVAGRGQLITAHPLTSLATGADVIAALSRAQFATDSVRHGVDAYQLVYGTVDPRGRSTIASGLLVLPRNGARGLDIVSYSHGTELNRTDAPSLGRDDWASAPAITYASAGFAAVAPDYLGLGLGPGPHPFLDVDSETTASVDLLRAARSFAADLGRTLRPTVYVTGFSQGATAATGLARALGEDPSFRLGALAPIGGAYDWRRVELPALLDGAVPAPWNVGYTAYFLVAWNRLHHLYDRPGRVFVAPYADTVEGLFDGVHAGPELVEALPASLDDLLTPYGMNLLRHPTGRLAAAMRAHDGRCAGWDPAAPVRLYLAAGDEQVPRGNSEHCLAGLRAGGADARIVAVADFDGYGGSVHLGANILATAEIVRWFGALRGS
jgi:hypothetical protein